MVYAGQHEYNAPKFEGMILDGTIRDDCTFAAWGLYKIWKEQIGSNPGHPEGRPTEL